MYLVRDFESLSFMKVELDELTEQEIMLIEREDGGTKSPLGLGEEGSEVGAGWSSVASEGGRTAGTASSGGRKQRSSRGSNGATTTASDSGHGGSGDGGEMSSSSSSSRRKFKTLNFVSYPSSSLSADEDTTTGTLYETDTRHGKYFQGGSWSSDTHDHVDDTDHLVRISFDDEEEDEEDDKEEATKTRGGGKKLGA